MTRTDMKRVLITGVAGLVGSNLASRLLTPPHPHTDTDFEVVGVDNLIGGYPDNVPENVEFHEVDVSEVSVSLLDSVDIVVHSACTPHEGLSVFSPSLITDNTYGKSVSLLSKSIVAGVKKFVFLSSMARYGSQSRIPFVEDMIPNPQDPYGIAKLAFEKTLINLAETHGFRYSIVIPHNVVGRGQKYNDPFRNVAGIMINRMLRGQQPVIYGDGSQMRSFSDIRDVVSPLVKIIETSAGDSESFNIGPDDNFISVNELSEMLAGIIGFNLDPLYLPGRPREVHLANCSAEKARRVLHYDPEISLDQTLRDMVSWVDMRGPLPFDHSLPVEIVSPLTPATWTDKTLFN